MKAGSKSHLNLRTSDVKHTISVPFLVSTDTIEQPFVRYVIEEMVRSTESQSASNNERTMVNDLSASVIKIKQENVEALINFFRTSSPNELCGVKVTKTNVIIPKNETVAVTCSVNIGPI